MRRLRADLVPDFCLKRCGPGPLYLCMGLFFAIFCPGPGREAMMAGNDLKVAAVAVIGLLLVRTPPGPTGSR